MKQNPYDNGMVRAGQRVLLKFEEGYLGLQVIGAQFLELKSYTLKNSNGDREELAGGELGTSENIVSFLNSNEQILEPEDSSRDTAYQIQLGISPSRMELYPRFGRQRTIGSGGQDAAPGNSLTPFTGEDSPYNNPSEQTEIFYVNDMEPLKLQPYNPTSEPLEANISVHINKLHYGVIRNPVVLRGMLQGQTPARLAEVGLGEKRRDQLEAPSWVLNSFGENLYSAVDLINSDFDTSGDGLASGAESLITEP